MITDILKYGVRYILSYAVVSVICTVLIVAGNDLLGQYSFVGNVSETFLQIDYKQWLPVCFIPAVPYSFDLFTLCKTSTETSSVIAFGYHLWVDLSYIYSWYGCMFFAGHLV
jgi:hypothetical protein